MFEGMSKSGYPIYVITDDTTPEEVQGIDPFSHIVRVRKFESDDGGYNYRYKHSCQFILCEDCSYDKDSCKTELAMEVEENFPELKI